jgi:XTP/dITP diphosphohydrolase
MFQQLLIATHNAGKVREYRELLADLPIEVLSLDEAGIREEVEETGTTFEANALLKARSYAQLSGLLTWADDSGLAVDALDGWPGVHSARHAGPDATDADRIQALLARLHAVDASNRGAAFHCVVALAAPDGRTWTTTGQCRGLLIDTPTGSGGFGYDPIFFVPEQGKTFAQLTSQQKNAISHRGIAARKAAQLLAELLLRDQAHSSHSK